MEFKKRYFKKKSEFIDLKPLDNKKTNSEIKLGVVILIMVFLFLIAFYFFENVFLKSEGIFRLVAIGITFSAAIMVVLYFRLLIDKTDKRNKINSAIVNYDFSNDENNTIEVRFKNFFKDELCYLNFRNNAIKIGLIDQNCKWLYKEKEILYFALLFSKLKENNYFKNTIENKNFCEVSSQFLDIKINSTMLTKYDLSKENNLIKAHHEKYYENDYSIFNQR